MSALPAPHTEPNNPPRDAFARVHTILFLAAAAVAALCIDFGTFHRLHNSDSIVPVMMSLYRWTPFYWEQDRFGMLVPLLTIPLKNPLTNLLAQSAIDIFCGLATFFLCARYVMRRQWLAIGAGSASLFLLFNDGTARFLYLGLQQPYGVGMLLGLGALLLLEFPRFSRPLSISLGFILLLAASWVDSAVIFVLLPLIFFRQLFGGDANRESAHLGDPHIQSREHSGDAPGATRGIRKRNFEKILTIAKRLLDREMIIAGALVCASFAVIYVYSGFVARSAAYGDWPYPPSPPWTWPAAWFQFAAALWPDYLDQKWGISVAVLLVLGAMVRLLLRGKIRRSQVGAATLMATALVSFLLIGAMAHISNAEFDTRFGLPSMVLLQIGAVAWALLPICSLLSASGRRAFSAAAMILFLCTPIFLCGRPSLARVRGDLTETIGQYTPDIIQSGATEIVGDYWNVWPAAFHANMKLYEKGSDRRVWGVTVRSEPTKIFWSQIPPAEMRLATIQGDPSVDYELNEYSFPPVAQTATYGDVIILTPSVIPGLPQH